MNPGYGVPPPQRYPPVPPPVPGPYGPGAKGIPMQYSGYGMNQAMPYGAQPAGQVGTYPGLMNASYLPRPMSVPPAVPPIAKVPRDLLDQVSDEYLRAKIIADRYCTFGADVIRSLSMVLHTTLTVNYRACVLFHRFHEAGEMGQRMAQFDDPPQSHSNPAPEARGSTGPPVAAPTESASSGASLKETFERLYGFRKVPPLDPEATHAIMSRIIKEAVAALLIAAKMEDDKCRVRPLLTVAMKMDLNCRARLFGGAMLSQSAFHMTIDDKEYNSFRDAVMKEEAKILERLSLQVHVDGPHRYVILLLRLLCGEPLACGEDKEADVKKDTPTPPPESATAAAGSESGEGAHPTDAAGKVGQEGGAQGAASKPKADVFHAWRPHEILWLNRALGYVNDCSRNREITKRFSAAVIACAAIHRAQPNTKPLNFKHSKDSDDERGGPGFVWCEAFGADKREVMNCRRFFDELYTDPATWTDWRSILWASQKRDRRRSPERDDGDAASGRKRRREDAGDDARRDGRHRRRREDSIDRRRRPDRYSREGNGGGRNDDSRRDREYPRGGRSGRGGHGGRGDKGNRQRGRGNRR
jgi:hypothetical protein